MIDMQASSISIKRKRPISKHSNMCVGAPEPQPISVEQQYYMSPQITFSQFSLPMPFPVPQHGMPTPLSCTTLTIFQFDIVVNKCRIQFARQANIDQIFIIHLNSFIYAFMKVQFVFQVMFSRITINICRIKVANVFFMFDGQPMQLRQ